MLSLDTYWLPLFKKEFPKFKLVPKQDSSFMRFLNSLLFVISFGKLKGFMKFTTTVGYTIYLSEDWGSFSDSHKIEVLRHERTHMRQRARYGIWFYFMYLLLPIPVLFAYYRTKFEQEGYEESMRCVVEERGTRILSDAKFREAMIARFTGPAYLWTWVRRSDIEKWYDQTATKLRLEYDSIRPKA